MHSEAGRRGAAGVLAVDAGLPQCPPTPVDFEIMDTKGIRFYGFALAGVLWLLAGCHRRDAAVPATHVEIPAEMPDTLVEETEPEPEVAPVVLNTTDEILRAMASSADSAAYARGILPQMARDVPEYAGCLLANEEEGFLIVDKATMKLYRYDRYGVEQERVGVAVAKPYGSKHKRRDNRTPEGYFTIEGIYNSTDWLYTDDDGNTSDVKGQFGPRFMRLRTPVSSQIGIHGTVAPWSIGGRRSHGCIRMTNENILRFAEICRPGWPVIVSPGPKDMAVNEEEGYDIPSVPVIPGRPRCKAAAVSPNAAKPEPKETESKPDTLNTVRQHEPDTIDTLPAESAGTPPDTIGTEAEKTNMAEPDPADPLFN